MLRMKSFTVENGAAVFLMGLGALIAFRWIFQYPWIANAVPGSEFMGVVAPLLFLAAGACCFDLSEHGQRSPLGTRIVWLCRGALLLIPSMILVEHLFQVNLGIDWQLIPTAPTADTPHPGRVSANAAFAFLLAGIAIQGMQKINQRYHGWIVSCCVYGVMAIGFASLTGYFLRIELLYRFTSGNKMLAPTAFAMTILGTTLWIIQQKMVDRRHDTLDHAQRRITIRSILILTFVVLSAGAAGFSVLRAGFEQSVTANIQLLASTNATSFSNVIDVSLRLPKTIATRPLVRSAFAALARDADDVAALSYFKEFGDSILSSGLTGIAFYSHTGKRISSSGVITQSALLKHVLTTAGQTAELRWSDGYTLFTENDVINNERLVGIMRTEERMPIVDRLLSEVRASSAATDILICGRQGANALCAPSRFYTAPSTIPMYTASGALNLPINRALAGETGVSVVTDLRGTPVYAAYLPVGQLGLGMVVKTSVELLNAPLRERFNQLLVIMVALVALGTSALLVQVQPLVRQINQERKRSTLILETSTDAFIALGIDGLVTDWNRAA